VIIDKGTFDAISLSENREELLVKYRKAISALYSNTKDSYFVITSCNFTITELLKHFEPDFQLHSQVKYPTFKFSGAEGSTVTTLAFKKQI